MILVAYFPTSSGQLMPMIPRSHDLGSLQLPPTHVLHAHLAAPTTSSLLRQLLSHSYALDSPSSKF